MRTAKENLDELFEILDDMSLLSDENFEKFCKLEEEYIAYCKQVEKRRENKNEN